MKSPCIRQCILDEKEEYCTGCYRSVEDVNRWAFLSEDERREVLNKTLKRKKELGFIDGNSKNTL